MPVWNRASFVKKAIESVIEQSFQDYELIIIDDGSEDNLKELVEPYLNDKIFYYQIEHSGASAARNYGLKKAKAPFIAYLDSDNTWHPEYLSTIYEALQGNGNKKHAAYCLAKVYRKNPVNGNIEADGTIGEPFSFSKLIKGNYIDLNAFVHSRKAIDYVGFFDEDLKRLIDWDLIIRITSLYEPVFVPETLVNYYCCVADNAITTIEDFKKANVYIGEKHSCLRKPIELHHDGLVYKWEKITEKQRINWIRINRQQYNTDEYAAWGYPFMLQIEPTNTCNLNCPLCPTGRKELNRKARHMSLDEFKSIIDNMKDYLLILILWDWGEPFMNPDFPEMIRYASQFGIKTVTSTNAHFLNDEQYLEKILTSGLTTLIVAIDSLNKKNYTVYRKKGNLQKVISGLKKAVKLKKRLGSETIINVRSVVMKQNEHEMDKLTKFAYKVGADRFTIKTLNPSCGSDHMDTELVPENPKYQRFEYKPGTLQRITIDQHCSRVWKMSNIFSNGDVVPCCYNFDASIKLGNINEHPFTEIWNNEAYRDFRKHIYHNQKSIEMCRNCWVNFQPSPAGWIVESLDLNEYVPIKLKERIKNRLRPTPIWPVLRFGKRTVLSGKNLITNVKQTSKTENIIQNNSFMPSQTKNLQLPLEIDKEAGRKSYGIFNGTTRNISEISCHVSVLAPGKTPHPPHIHKEEEILIVLSGQAELIFMDSKDGNKEKRCNLSPGSFVYYPVGNRHTITNSSNKNVTYLMFKWSSERVMNSEVLEMTIIQSPEKEQTSLHQKGFATKVLFESCTSYLSKLHCHISTLEAHSGYPPHADEYEVAILVLSGKIKTLGENIGANGVIYYAAGQAHGMENIENTIAKYLVFEFHK